MATVDVDDGTYERWLAALRSKRVALMDHIQTTAPLLEKMYELGVLSKPSKERIAVNLTNYDKTTALLDYMQKRPKQDFVRFRDALAYDNQEHILEIFDS